MAHAFSVLRPSKVSTSTYWTKLKNLSLASSSSFFFLLILTRIFLGTFLMPLLQTNLFRLGSTRTS